MFFTLKKIMSGLSMRRRMSKRRADPPAIIDVADHSQVLTIFILIMLWAVCTVLLTFPVFHPINLKLIEGQQAPQTIFARDNFNYEDAVATDALRRQAEEAEPVCFNISPEDNTAIIERLSALRGRIAATKTAPPDPKNDPLLASLPPAGLHALQIIADSQEIMDGLHGLLEKKLAAGVVSDSLRRDYKLAQAVRILDTDGREHSPKPVEELATPQRAAEELTVALMNDYPIGIDAAAMRQALITVIGSVIGDGGNLRYDEARSAQRRLSAKTRVKPVWIEVLKGEPIVIRDTVVGADTQLKLVAYEHYLQKSATGEIMLRRVVSCAIICVLMVLYLAVAARCAAPDQVKGNRQIALGGLILVAALLFNYFMVKTFSFFSGSFNIPPNFVQDVIPVGLAAAVTVPVFGLPIGLFASMFVACISALMLTPEPELMFRIMLSYIGCGFAVGFAVRRATNYRQFAVRVMLAVFAVLFVLDANNLNNPSAQKLVMSLELCLANGFLTAIAGLILIFIIELVFHVSTDMSLLLQCDINHPLLKELQLKAPGTSFHSQTVATLAETAAKEVGANPLKCRVGALFHDIGKLKKPEYFTENNIGTANMHEDLSPAMSAIILRSHVEDGIELARQYRLPRIVRDMIQQHHGTDIMRFFYDKAMKSGATVLTSQFSYPGPLPQDKEVVIVNLADACEAACRSLQHPTAQNIETMVTNIFRSRLESGQLNDAQLTVSELAAIRGSFIRTLTTMYHSRIAYPEQRRAESAESSSSDGGRANSGEAQ